MRRAPTATHATYTAAKKIANWMLLNAIRSAPSSEHGGRQVLCDVDRSGMLARPRGVVASVEELRFPKRRVEIHQRAAALLDDAPDGGDGHVEPARVHADGREVVHVD